MKTKNIYEEQEAVGRLSNDELSHQAQGAGGMTGILSAIELSRRARMQRAAAGAAVAQRVRDGGGTVLSELSRDAARVAAPAPHRQALNSGGIVQGYNQGTTARPVQPWGGNIFTQIYDWWNRPEEVYTLENPDGSYQPGIYQATGLPERQTQDGAEYGQIRFAQLDPGTYEPERLDVPMEYGPAIPPEPPPEPVDPDIGMAVGGPEEEELPPVEEDYEAEPGIDRDRYARGVALLQAASRIANGNGNNLGNIAAGLAEGGASYGDAMARFENEAYRERQLIEQQQARFSREDIADREMGLRRDLAREAEGGENRRQADMIGYYNERDRKRAVADIETSFQRNIESNRKFVSDAMENGESLPEGILSYQEWLDALNQRSKMERELLIRRVSGVSTPSE